MTGFIWFQLECCWCCYCCCCCLSFLTFHHIHNIKCMISMVHQSIALTLSLSLIFFFISQLIIFSLISTYSRGNCWNRDAGYLLSKHRSLLLPLLLPYYCYHLTTIKKIKHPLTTLCGGWQWQWQWQWRWRGWSTDTTTTRHQNTNNNFVDHTERQQKKRRATLVGRQKWKEKLNNNIIISIYYSKECMKNSWHVHKNYSPPHNKQQSEE